MARSRRGKRPVLNISRWGRWSCLWAALSVICLPGEPISAADSFPAPHRSAARDESIRAIPFNSLSTAATQKVRGVLDKTTIYRRMPTKVIHCNPDFYLFFVRHPEVIVNIWEELGMSSVSLQRTGQKSFLAGDGKGTLGQVQFLHDSEEVQLLYAEGSYEGPLVKWPIKAKCVLLLRSEYLQKKNGQPCIMACLDAFIHLDRLDVELLAKTFQPLIGRNADYNFTETISFVERLSHAAKRNPRGMKRLYARLQHVRPEIRQQLLDITERLSKPIKREPAILRTSGQRPIYERKRPHRSVRSP